MLYTSLCIKFPFLVFFDCWGQPCPLLLHFCANVLGIPRRNFSLLGFDWNSWQPGPSCILEQLPVHYLLRLTNKFDIFQELKGKSMNGHGSKLKGQEPSCFYNPNHPTLFWCRTTWSNSRFDDQWGVVSRVSIKSFFFPHLPGEGL